MKRNRKKQAGFSLMEAVLATSISGFVLIGAAQFSAATSKNSQAEQAEQKKAKEMVQTSSQMVEDIRKADYVLAGFPPSAPIIYSTKDTTIILRQPDFDPQGTRVPNSFKIVAYTKVPAMGANGPFMVRRLTGSLVNGIPTALVLDRVMVRAAANLTFAYISKQVVPIENGRTKYKIASAPASATNARGHVVQAWYEGVDLLANGFATLNSRQLELSSPLPQGGIIEVRIPVDGNVTCGGDGSNNCSLVEFGVTGQYKYTDSNGVLVTGKAEAIETAELRNAKAPVMTND
ncbi:MAG: hypothetical protein KIT11_10190 [Fimbriimonadaceae bacterium]|nr:hypothetical protein [Fimbriimonadaceae bacterium]QYK55691.1 MAG: hypothetical protein KF733_11860 [Fimbriimonadaceae bacterium]